MRRPFKFVATPLLALIIVLGGAGCPIGGGSTPPNFLAQFLVSPEQLDFGTDLNTLTLFVSKNYTQQPLPQFSVSDQGTPWLNVSPKTGNSTGPDDPAAFTVTVNRDRMTAGTNTANILITAPGIASRTVPVSARARLVAAFSASPENALVGQNVQFTDESTVVPEDGPIVSRLWTFGDGATSQQQNPKHKYQNPGVYTVTLSVQTATLSDTHVEVDLIVVTEAIGPTADFVASNTKPPAGTPVQFTDQSDPGDAAAVTSWLWSFGDGGTSTQQNPTHTYSVVGKYDVSLTATTEFGSDTVTKKKYIKVQPVGPTAEFVASNRFPAIGQQVQFTDLSDPGTSPITNWLWNFGDGTTSQAQNPTHIYTAAASYTVYLNVTTIVGSDSETKPDYIVVSQP